MMYPFMTLEDTTEIVHSNGYSKEEVDYFMDIIKSTAHLIIEFSKEGGFMNAEI